MNIAIIGSGGREHSICHQLSKSKLVSKILLAWKCWDQKNS